ncbi:MAG: cation transporter [Clostridia bacterium]|nr:cation transporter [Clostridia bacterium]
MTNLLIRLFIKDSENIKSPDVRRSYGTLGSVVGIIFNLILAIGKYTVGFLFGAISLMADGINNLSDAGSQIISFISFKMAAKPADRDHPFGHARIEYVASMIVSFFILLVSWNLLSDSLEKILDPEITTEFSWLMIIVLGVSVIIKLWLCYFNRRLADKINSSVMKATAADSLSDAIATSAVLVAMLVFKFTGFDADGYMGIAVAVVIFIAGIKILNETKNAILGESADPEVVESVKRIVSEFPDALGIHDMVVHSYGPGQTIVTLHIEVDGDKSVFDSHDMIDMIERRLNTELGIQSNIHMDPIVTNDAEVSHMREVTRGLVKEIDERLDIHDFRFVRGVTHTNLIFDISAPFELKMSDNDLKKEIDRRISQHNSEYFTVTTIDRT